MPPWSASVALAGTLRLWLQVDATGTSVAVYSAQRALSRFLQPLSPRFCPCTSARLVSRSATPAGRYVSIGVAACRWAAENVPPLTHDLQTFKRTRPPSRTMQLYCLEHGIHPDGQVRVLPRSLPCDEATLLRCAGGRELSCSTLAPANSTDALRQDHRRRRRCLQHLLL